MDMLPVILHKSGWFLGWSYSCFIEQKLHLFFVFIVNNRNLPDLSDGLLIKSIFFFFFCFSAPEKTYETL